MFSKPTNQLFLLLLISINCAAQPFENSKFPFDFTQNSIVVGNPSGGGLNNPEIQFVDINADGIDELFFLDSEGSFGYFEKSSGSYKIEEKNITGLDFKNWFYFIDIDADSDLDLFTGGESNFIRLFENIGSTVSPHFILSIDSLLDRDGSPIISESVSNPIFVDIDADDDFDYFIGSQSGEIVFFENVGTPENFSFEYRSDSWEDILVVGGGLLKRQHGASSLEFADIDADDDLDLFIGDFFSNSLYYIRNNGTAHSPDMELISDVYPTTGDSVDTKGFNMPRFHDHDDDGDLDLFVTILFDPTVQENFIMFENQGSETSADFVKIERSPLNLLDAGTKSVPRFIDIDGDEDLDLLIGKEGISRGTIHFWENIGNELKPDYTFITDEFEGISVELSASPEFGDIDGDGDLDLILGTLLGNLIFYENLGAPTSYSFTSAVPLYDSDGNQIKQSVYSRPLLYDFDLDADLDLIVGGFDGKISFFRNIGSSKNHSFRKEDNIFDGIDVGGQSSPAVYDFNNDGKFDLITGNREGNLLFFENQGTNVNPSFSPEGEEIIEQKYGMEISPFFTDLDGDGDEDLVLGNFRGGLYFFNNSLLTYLEPEIVNYENQIETLSLSLYPNPFNSQTTIILKTLKFGNFKIDLYNILGEKVYNIFSGELSPGIHRFFWKGTNSSGENIVSGNYIVRASTDKSASSRLIQILK